MFTIEEQVFALLVIAANGATLMISGMLLRPGRIILGLTILCYMILVWIWWF